MAWNDDTQRYMWKLYYPKPEGKDLYPFFMSNAHKDWWTKKINFVFIVVSERVKKKREKKQRSAEFQRQRGEFKIYDIVS